jgi:hypothetical protein
VLVLTIIAGFLSVAIGGCTSAFVGGVADLGDNISDFQRHVHAHSDANQTRREAAELRASASGHALIGFLGAALSITGGVMAFRNYNSAATQTIGGRTFKCLAPVGTGIFAVRG